MHRSPRAGGGRDAASQLWRALLRDKRGGSYVEYLILVAVVALLSIPAFIAAGAEMNANTRTLGADAASGLPLMGF